MSQNYPPIIWVPIFDTLNYTILDSNVTLGFLISNYLNISGGLITGNLFVNGLFSIQNSSLVIGGSTVLSTATELNYLHNVTPGTSTASTALVMDSSNNISLGGNLTLTGTSNQILMNGTIAGTIFLNSTLVNTITFGSSATIGGIFMNGSADLITIVNTTASTSSSTGALQIAGGAYFGGNSIFNGNLTVNGTLTIPSLSLSGTLAITNTTDSTSVSTGSITTLGGVGIAKSLYVGTNLNVGSNINVSNGTLNLNHNGSNIGFTNGSNSGLIELSNSPDLLRCVNGYALNISSGGISIGSASTLAARYPIDMGSTANDVQICLYQSGSNFLYGIGSNNSALELHTGGSFNFYNGTTANGSLGVNILSISSGGNVTAGNNVFAT